MGFLSDMGSKLTQKTSTPTTQNNNKWYAGDQPTSKEIMGRIGQISKTDRVTANKAYALWQEEQLNPTSQYYNPHIRATNKAVSNLASYGIDTSNINDDWFKKNSYLTQYLDYRGQTNSPSAPTKKSTVEQKAAWEYYQLWLAEDATKKAETQWNNLQKELSYWAQRTDRNYSNDEILAKIDWKKYDELTSMDKNKYIRPNEYNRAIGYSKDAMDAVIWAARNGGGTGNATADMFKMAMGEGNQWQYNEEIANRLNPKSASFQPYSLGCTNLDDEALHFGVSGFSKQFIKEHDGLQYEDTQEGKFMRNIIKADNNQDKVDEATAALDAWMVRFAKNMPPEEAKKKLDDVLAKGEVWVNGKKVKIDILNDIDKSIGKEGEEGTGDLLALTRGTDYKYANALKKFQDMCAGEAQKKDGNRFISSIYASVDDVVNTYNYLKKQNEVETKTHATYRPSEQEIEIAKAKDKELADDAERTEIVSVPSEQAAMKNQWSVLYDNVRDAVGGLKLFGGGIVNALAPEAIQNSIYYYSGAVLKGFAPISTYERNEQNITDLEAKKAEYAETLGDLIYYGHTPESEKTVEVTIDGKTYQVSLVWNEAEKYNPETFENEFVGTYNPNGAYLNGKAANLPNTEETQTALNAAIQEANVEHQKANAARGLTVTDEQAAAVDEYWRISSDLETAKERRAETQEAYDAAKKEIDDRTKIQDQTIAMMQLAGVDTTDMENAKAVTGFFLNFTKYEPTKWASYNFYHEVSKELISKGGKSEEAFKVAEEGDTEILQAIDVAKTMLEYADEKGMQVPDDVRENVLRYIESLEEQHKDFEYMSMIRNEDFETGTAEGRKRAESMGEVDFNAFDNALIGGASYKEILKSQPSWGIITTEQRGNLLRMAERVDSLRESAAASGEQIPMSYGIEDILSTYNSYLAELKIEDRMFGAFPFNVRMGDIMTDYEIATYYYLLGTKGSDAAQEYSDHIALDGGVLNSRLRERTEQGARDLADKGFFGRRAADVLSMLLSPISAIQSLGYSANIAVRKASGERVEWNPDSADLSSNIYKKAARDEINKEIVKAYGEGTVLQKFMSGLQEIISNRGDSIVNGLVFGLFTGGIANDMLQEFVSALPMAVAAATDAVSEAKESGASDTQLLGIYATTLLFEAGTEAISLDNIKNTLKLGEDLTTDGLKAWAKEWLTSSGISEMIGETVTEYVEQLANTISLGENSDYAKAVEKYKSEGMSETEAKERASLDQVQDLLHTALISYLSPGADIGSFTFGRYLGYRSEAKFRQETGISDDSWLDVYKQYKAEKKEQESPRNKLHEKTQAEIEEIERNNSLPKEETEASEPEAGIAVPETAPVEPSEPTPEQKEAQELTLDYEILESAKSADASTQTASVSSVLDTQGTPESGDTANAAAANMDGMFGDKSPAEGVQDLVIGAHASVSNVQTVKQAIQTAALSTNSAAGQTMQSEAYQKADPAQKAEMLAATVETDLNNPDVQQQIASATRENRIARAEKDLVGSPDLKTEKDAEGKAYENLLLKQKATKEAQEQSNSYENALEAARETLRTTDVADENGVSEAIANLRKASEVNEEYKQHLKKAQEEEAKANSDYEQAANDYVTKRREMATQIVDEQDQQRAEAKAQAEVEAQAQAEAEVQQQIEQEETDNATIADAEGFIAQQEANGATLTEEDKEEIRKAFAEEVNNQQRTPEQQTTAQQDENAPSDAYGRLDDPSAQKRRKAAAEIERRFGYKIVPVNPYKKEGFYFQGKNERENKVIYLDNTEVTTNDIMYKVLGHELTHIAEQSGMYKNLANTIARLFYGSDADIENAIRNLEKNNGKPTSRLEADILARKKDYDKRGKVDYRYAAEEFIADRMGDIINQPDDAKRQDLINRLVSEDPKGARRLLDSIKSFLKKAVGMKGAWLSNTQKTVDMLEAAINDAQGKQTVEKEMNERFMIQNGAPYLADQIRDAKDTLDTMEPVKSVSSKVDLSKYQSIAQSKEAQVKLWAKEKADAFGRNLYREGFGEAELSNSAIKTIFSYLGYTNDAAIAAFEALPEVYRYGEEIETHEDHKGRGVESHTFAAPVEIDGERGNMGVIVRKSRNGTNFKTYKVILPDGREFIIRDEKAELAPEAGSEEATRTDSVSNGIITPDETAVKRSSPIVENESGEPLAEELPGGTVTVDTERFSLASFDDIERDKVRHALYDAKDGNGKPRFTRQEVDNFMNNAFGIAAIIAADRTRLDFEADPERSMAKPNADYGISIDASTLCAKRLLYQGTFDAIQRALPNTPLMPNDLIDLANMMREMGYETPCGICYVESRRRNLGKFADEWLKTYDGEYVPTLQEVTTSDGLENLRNEHRQAYDDYIDAMKKLNQRNPKVVQLRTDYRGEIKDMTDAAVQKAINHGGLRLQSFSDFETPHLLDMVQVVYDMASKGLTSQAYTKVPNFAWVFGDTGIKINLSLIAKGTGVDENGKLIFDDVEGMPYEEAMKLRNRYSKNVGTILVGKNDAHILAAMADDTIDFIIPFHRSGWTKKERNLMEPLQGYQDYTNDQNERKILKRKANGKGYQTIPAAKSKIKNLEPVGAEGYWDFSKSGTENAEEYLRRCAADKRIPKFSRFLIDNGDGSFRLPTEAEAQTNERYAAIRKGYWKTLIDFKMYDNEGNPSEQTAVTPNINMVEAERVLADYDLSREQPGKDTPPVKMQDNNSLPVAQPVVDRYLEEFKEKHPRERYSLPSDAPYLSAVDHGDMETAQRMVDEKAQEAGYTLVGYHGTNLPTLRYDTEGFGDETDYENKRLPFTIFKAGQSGGIYMASNREVSEGFASRFDKQPGTVMSLYIKFDNPLVVNEHVYSSVPRYYNIPTPSVMKEAGYTQDTLSTEEISAFAQDNGYDGVIIEGIREGTDTQTDDFIAFSPDQIKLADPVTYDDSGNVIPLSERFNTQNNDIRYSLPSDDVLRQQIRQYIANGGVLGQQQTQQAQPQTVPLRANEGYRQWGNKGAQQSDELVEEAKQHVLNNPYTRDTNMAELNRAIDWIRSNKGYADDDGFDTSLKRVTGPNFNYRTKDGQARMIAVMALAVARNDTRAQVELAEAYNKQGTDLGQALQARKLFRLMTPMGRVASIERMLVNVRQETGNQDIKLSDWIIQAASEASDEGEFNKIRKAAAAELAEQIPANWKDKLRSLRMLSMLGNPKTHVRNFIGNALFVPVVGLKNKLGAAMEMATHQNERTKTLSLRLNKDIREFVKQDAEFKKDELTGEAKYNDGTLIQQEQKAFKGFMQKVIDFNSNALEKEDWFFLKGHYRRALGGWMQANGYTVEQVKSNPVLLEQGRAYAINEAQKATYRDFNGLADKLNKMTQRNETTGQKALGFAVDAILPFRKTPANILKRGIEYSPVGLVRGLKNAMIDVKNGSITANQAIDRICSGLAGTAVMAMGYFLSQMGMVTCGMDDDDDKFEKEQGNQKYSIKLFGQDVTTTLDWAAPVCMPFFVGAALQNEMAKDGDFDVNEMINAISNIGEPVLNLSMLDGVNTLFKTSQNDDTDAITQIAAKVISNYASSYVPSLLGAIARTVDDKRRAVYVPSGQGKGVTGTFNYAWEQVENKIPGLSQTNIPVRDVFGNVETKNLAERAFENFIWPGYIKHYKNDPILNEMDRLYNANVTDSEKMIPSDPPKTISYNKETIKLNAQEWDTFKTVRGQTAYEMLTDLINRADYKNAADEDQVQMIKSVWDYATKVGKQAVIPDFGLGEAEETVESIAKTGKISSYKDKMMKSLESGDYEGFETMVEALRELDVEESTIKTKIGDKYRKEYKKAYIKGDTNKMSKIEEILFYSGYDFDFGKWEEQAEEGRMN